MTDENVENAARHLSVEAIAENPRNPRERMDETALAELADSIAEQGLLQPILVRPRPDRDDDRDADAEYEVVHGNRRLRAVEQLGHDEIGATVRDLSDREALEIATTENLQREDVSAIAEARSFRTLIEEFGLTQAEVAERVGASQSHVSNRLALLDYPAHLRRDILHQILSPWQAREIERVWPEYDIRDVALDFDLSVAELREVADAIERGDPTFTISTEWHAEDFDGLWSRGPPIDDPEEARGFLDVNGNPAPTAGELAHGLRWEARTLGDDEEGESRLDLDERALRPIVVLAASPPIIALGYTRLSIAEREGYDGAFDVELRFRPEMFARPQSATDDDADDRDAAAGAD